MSVYVDDMYAPFGRMKMCHMMGAVEIGWSDLGAMTYARRKST